MDGGHKKVISYFSGTAWLRSRRSLFQQFIQGNKAQPVVLDVDVLAAGAAGAAGPQAGS